MKSLLQSVLWPAVAGNVAWAFFTVALQRLADGEGGQVPERLTLLGILVVYLCLDWTHTEAIKEDLRRYYWIGDVPLAMSIALLAIAAQARVGEGWWYLLGVFGVAAIANLFDAWAQSGAARDWRSRGAWLGLYAMGAAILMVGRKMETAAWGWHLPMATAAIVVPWGLARFTEWRYVRWLKA